MLVDFEATELHIKWREKKQPAKLFRFLLLFCSRYILVKAFYFTQILNKVRTTF